MRWLVSSVSSVLTRVMPVVCMGICIYGVQIDNLSSHHVYIINTLRNKQQTRWTVMRTRQVDEREVHHEVSLDAEDDSRLGDGEPF
jgi:hypothetical protein